MNFVLLLVLTASALGKAAALGTMALMTLAFVVIVSLVVLSALLEQRPRAPLLEGARVLVLLVLLSVYGPRLFALLLGNP